MVNPCALFVGVDVVIFYGSNFLVLVFDDLMGMLSGSGHDASVCRKGGCRGVPGNIGCDKFQPSL